MCGIAAIYTKNKSIDKEKLILKMTNHMSYRGPDASNIVKFENIILGHRRLSIIDLNESSNQPMTDTSGRYYIIFNGEIYNYKDLKRDFPSNYKTDSDTEVILELFKIFGENCVDYLNGMFSFLIWDKEVNQIFIARDRFGIKPLYYYLDGDFFIVASEIKSILSSGLVPIVINYESITDYFYNQAEWTTETSIKNIFQLLSGQKAVFKDGTLKKAFYWKMSEINQKTVNPSYETANNTVKKLLYESVERQMIADVPVGAFLSGGIDSSALVSLMSEVSTKPIETFSITFGETEFDESKFALNVAKMYKTQHHDIRLKSDELLHEIPTILKGLDRLNSDGANIYMVSKATASMGLKVALSGIGADELFCGYYSFRQFKQLSRFNKIWQKTHVFHKLVKSIMSPMMPKSIQNKFDELLSLPSFGIEDVYPIFRNVIHPVELNELSKLPLMKSKNILLSEQLPKIKSFPTLSQYSIAELSEYTTNVVLNCTDQMSMKHSLEVRVPFLDHKLVEYVLTLPDGYKIQKAANKILLLDSMKQRIPIENINRPKMGFTLPYDVWLKGPLKLFGSDKILSLSTRSFMNESAVIDYWDGFQKGNPKYTWSRVWSMIVMEEWLQNLK